MRALSDFSAVLSEVGRASLRITRAALAGWSDAEMRAAQDRLLSGLPILPLGALFDAHRAPVPQPNGVV